jgi:transposase
MDASKHPATRRYPPELRERAVRMVFEAIDYNSERHGVITRVAAQLGVDAESLRTWVRQSEVDSSHQAGTTTEEKLRITQLEREVRELRRANETLKSASLFFATELDGRRPR